MGISSPYYIYALVESIFHKNQPMHHQREGYDIYKEITDKIKGLNKAEAESPDVKQIYAGQYGCRT